MQLLLPKIMVLLLALSLVAFGTPPQQQQQLQHQRPAWIDNPHSVGKVVGLGHAATHIKGRSAQRELASRRALDEIARQMGVTISNTTVINQQVTNSSSSTSMVGNSVQTVDGRVVNAVIHGEWQEGGTIYILMVGH